MNKGKASALLPIIVFLALFIGSGVITGDFYKMPAVVGFLIALIVAFVQNPKLKFEEKLNIMANGAGHENIMIMCLIFILAGAFSNCVKAAGGVESTVSFGLSILPGSVAVVGIFVVACFISISMGTSVGTITALAPLAVGISDKTGIGLGICVGAAVCGAMFGDNLSMVSDTTIAAVRTQDCQMRDKFRENFKIVLPAAILTAILFFIRTMGTDFTITDELNYNFIRILPYLIVLIGAIIGMNVFMLLVSGIVLSLAVGLIYHDFVFSEVFAIIGDGISSMFEITVISILVAGIVALIKENGGIDFILYHIHKSIHSKKGAEIGIAGLASLTDLSTANNTVAIVIAGPIVKEIAVEYNISAKRSASLIDIFTSVWQGIIPYGAQLLSAAMLTGMTPFDIIPYCYYPILMGVSALAWILFVKTKD